MALQKFDFFSRIPSANVKIQYVTNVNATHIGMSEVGKGKGGEFRLL